MRSALIKLAGYAVLLNSISISVQAQKSDNIQENSIWAGAKVNIDGLATEWNNNLQVYNRATNVFYTIANDDKNLYLVIQSSSQAITNKIMRGGISFKINSNGKKEEEGAVITFPLIRRADLRTLNEEMTGAKNEDAAMLIGKQLTALKEINVIGIKGITDTVITIYNPYGIKAVASINNKNILTYELAIPLDLLGQVKNTNGFAYNIKLNGLRPTPRKVPVSIPGVAGNGAPVSVFKDTGPVTADNMTPQMTEIMASTVPTDVWGKYTLAKKE